MFVFICLLPLLSLRLYNQELWTERILQQKKVVESHAVNASSSLHNSRRSLPYQTNISLIPRKKDHSSPRAVLIIAVYPISWTRLSTLWSQLECFTSKIDAIVVAAPDWSRDILDPVLQKAKQSIPILREKMITARYFVNDRYDVGLWCDAVRVTNETTFGYSTTTRTPNDTKNHDSQNTSMVVSLLKQFDHFVLINDSVWAVEHSSEVLDALRIQRNNQTLQMVSLSYSHLGNETLIPHGFWLESVKRAFTMEGLTTFLKNKCVPATHSFYCPNRLAAWKRKRCIVENFEIDVSKLYPNGTLLGLYPSDVPSRYLEGKNLNVGGIRTWVVNLDYWEHYLREERNFPVAKASWSVLFEEAKKRRPDDFLTCSRYMGALRSLNLTWPSSLSSS